MSLGGEILPELGGYAAHFPKTLLQDQILQFPPPYLWPDQNFWYPF